ncbi:50S ribosomal protein L21 [Rickettsiales bacterium LUAb2]
MFAVIKLAGAQHLVRKGDIITVNKLNNNIDDVITITDILSKGDSSNVEVGTPLVNGNVTAKVLEHGKADKVIIFKKIRRHNHRRKKGFRQSITKIEITDIK